MRESLRMPSTNRKRKPGGGRKRKLDVIEGLSEHIAAMLEVEAVADAAFHWTMASKSRLADQLRQQGLDVSRRTIEDYFRVNGYRLSQNRNLPDGRGPEEVRAQIRIVGQAVRRQMDAKADVLFLEGEREIFPNVVKHTEEAHHICPWEIQRIEEEVERVVIQPGNDQTEPLETFRLRTIEEQEQVRKQKRNVTILPLEKMVTDRNPAIFAAILIRHWYSTIDTRKPLLVLTHNTSPDTVFPLQWSWAMNKLCQEVNVPFSVSRIPSATWKFTGEQTKLFAFKAQDRREKTNRGYMITARIAPYSNNVYDEIKAIPAILDHRRFPKTRKISKRMLNAMRIERHALFDDWNYSFVPGDE